MAEDGHDHEGAFRKGGLMFMERTASTIAALSIVVGIIWLAFKPYLDGYLGDLIKPLGDKVGENSAVVAELRSDIQVLKDLAGSDKPFVEIFSIGIVAEPGPFVQGETVQIDYLLRRNSDCPATIVDQFYSLRFRRVLTRFTTESVSTRAGASFDPFIFPIDLPVPQGLPPGRYSRHGILRPDRSVCPGQRDVIVPPSMYFEVVAREE